MENRVQGNSRAKSWGLWESCFCGSLGTELCRQRSHPGGEAQTQAGEAWHYLKTLVPESVLQGE